MSDKKPTREVSFVCNNVTCVVHELHTEEAEPARRRKWGACLGEPAITVRRDGFYTGGTEPYPWRITDDARNMGGGDCYLKCVRLDCLGCKARKGWDDDAREEVAKSMRQSRIRATQDLLREEPETVLAMINEAKGGTR